MYGRWPPALAPGTATAHDGRVLEILGLSKQYGAVVALDDASFVVPPGRIVGFLGPNGAGKTTAMRCIFGLVEPDAGRIRWNGRAVSPADRLTFGYMPEERGLYPKMRVREQLIYFGKLYRLGSDDAARAADHWLHTLGLIDRAGSRLDELSHGNQQRIQLAVALLHQPRLLVLDEPFAGLDPIGVEAMSEILESQARAGVGIVFSSHQLDLVEDVCQDVVIIDRGRVVLAGPTAELQAASGMVRIEIEVNGRPWAPDIGGMVDVSRDQRHEARLADRSVELDVILDKAAAQGEVTSVFYGPPRVSDLFLEAVRR